MSDSDVTLDELWQLAYFGGTVRLDVVGGHDTVRVITWQSYIYHLPADIDDLRAALAKVKSPPAPPPPT